MPVFCILSCLALMLAAPALAGAESAWTPLVDLRVRQELQRGVFHFAPESDRDWVRVRTRAGVRYDRNDHRFELRLANEHRHTIKPEGDFDADEVILDRAFWSWPWREEDRITLGRQDIIWPGGFLMLEGHPLDGSRSIYHNALRWQGSMPWGRVDASLIHNSKRDDFVLIDDEKRDLTDADETGLALRLTRGEWSGALIYKYENDPDGRLDELQTVTLDLRRDSALGEEGRWHADLALQFQDGFVRSAADQRVDCGSGWALAGETAVSGSVFRGWKGEIDAFGYSGLDETLRAFRTPWGRWPKWSELYLYTLIGESTPGRVHVAAWEDMASAGLTLRRSIATRFEFGFTHRYLHAISRDESRGQLTVLKLDATLGRGIRGHLLWEHFDPGAFHDGRYDLPALLDPVDFLRWEVSWAL